MGIKSNSKSILRKFYFSLVWLLISVGINYLLIMEPEIAEFAEDYVTIGILSFLILIGFMKIFDGIDNIRNYPSDDTLVEILVFGEKLLLINLISVIGSIFIWINTRGIIIKQAAICLFLYSIPITLSWVEYQLSKEGMDTEFKKRNTFFWRFNSYYKKPESRFRRVDIIHQWGYWFIGYWIIGLGFIWVAKVEGMNLLGLDAVFYDFPVIIIAIFFIRPVLFIIDLLFNLVVVLDGECTGYYEKISKSRSGNISIRYVYIITNYSEEAEVKFTTYQPLYFYKGNNVRVYYTMFSKRLMNHRSR